MVLSPQNPGHTETHLRENLSQYWLSSQSEFWIQSGSKVCQSHSLQVMLGLILYQADCVSDQYIEACNVKHQYFPACQPGNTCQQTLRLEAQRIYQEGPADVLKSHIINISIKIMESELFFVSSPLVLTMLQVSACKWLVCRKYIMDDQIYIIKL